MSLGPDVGLKKTKRQKNKQKKTDISSFALNFKHRKFADVVYAQTATLYTS